MNAKKLKHLFAAAREEKPPMPAEGFDLLVMQRIRLDSTREEFSIFDQLSAWFPKLALAAIVMITMCVASEFIFFRTAPSVADSAAQLSDQLLFAEN